MYFKKSFLSFLNVIFFRDIMLRHFDEATVIVVETSFNIEAKMDQRNDQTESIFIHRN